MGEESLHHGGSGNQGVYHKHAQAPPWNWFQVPCSPCCKGNQEVCREADGHQGRQDRHQTEQGHLGSGTRTKIACTSSTPWSLMSTSPRAASRDYRPRMWKLLPSRPAVDFLCNLFLELQ